MSCRLCTRHRPFRRCVSDPEVADEKSGGEASFNLVTQMAPSSPSSISLPSSSSRRMFEQRAPVCPWPGRGSTQGKVASRTGPSVCPKPSRIFLPVRRSHAESDLRIEGFAGGCEVRDAGQVVAFDVFLEHKAIHGGRGAECRELVILNFLQQFSRNELVHVVGEDRRSAYPLAVTSPSRTLPIRNRRCSYAAGFWTCCQYFAVMMCPSGTQRSCGRPPSCYAQLSRW